MNGTATEYFLNGSQILAEKTGDTVTWFFYDSQGTRIGMVYGSNLYYYLYNLQGDVTALVRASTGKIAATYYAADRYRTMGGKTWIWWSVVLLGCWNDSRYNSLDITRHAIL